MKDTGIKKGAIKSKSGGVKTNKKGNMFRIRSANSSFKRNG